MQHNVGTEDVFSKNRAEELENDVFEEFVVPPYWDRLDLRTAHKPRVIIGGRGCGKTMLLKYVSHDTTFSTRRIDIPDDAISSICLYWKADTQFCNQMALRGLEPDVWQSAFSHMLSLILGREFLRSLRNIAASSCGSLTLNDLEDLSFERVRNFDAELPVRFVSLTDSMLGRLDLFQSWVSNVRSAKQPVFIPCVPFLNALISELCERFTQFRKTIFNIYIDEYENLRLEQKIMVNTLLKHSEKPLIFHLAAKRNAFLTRSTLGEESITNISDFRIVDIEELQNDDFDVFAAEILFLRLQKQGLISSVVQEHELRDTNRVSSRTSPQYKTSISSHAKKIFARMSEDEIARNVFKEEGLISQLRRTVGTALKRRKSKLDPAIFVDRSVPQASIVCSSLLYRTRLSPGELSQEMDRLRSGKPNRFTGKTNWIHNNFVGCLLRLYEPYSRACPIYAGFETFCLLARGNIRHLLELCHKSASLFARTHPDSFVDRGIDPQLQAEAARSASAEILQEVRGLGKFGNRLHTFVLRLGSVFSIAHQRDSQSEPEQTHFSIKSGTLQLSEAESEFLKEAVKWSILFEERETKIKGEWRPEDFEYVLNPIFSPYFGISYRKRRKLELTMEEFVTLVSGDYGATKALLQNLSGRWNVELSSANPTLFSHIQDKQ